MFLTVHHYTCKECLLAFSRILMLFFYTLSSCTTLFYHHTMTQLVPVLALARNVVIFQTQQYHMTLCSHSMSSRGPNAGGHFHRLRDI